MKHLFMVVFASLLAIGGTAAQQGGAVRATLDFPKGSPKEGLPRP